MQNKALLIQLGLDRPLLEPLEKAIKKPTPQKKRKISEALPDDEKPPVAKLQRTDSSDSTPETGPRRSSRNAGKVVDYKSEMIKGSPVPVAYSSGVKMSENEGPLGREDGPRRHNPYVSPSKLNFGHDSLVFFFFSEKLTALFLESKLVLGGRPGKDAARTRFTRKIHPS